MRTGLWQFGGVRTEWPCRYAVWLLLLGLFPAFDTPTVLGVGAAQKPATQAFRVAQTHSFGSQIGSYPAGSSPYSENGDSAVQNQIADLLVIVTDENGLAVPFARVTLSQPRAQFLVKGETNYAGRRVFRGLPPGSYHLLVEKEGFYAVHSDNVEVGTVRSTQVTLNRVREVHEKVNVVASPAAINPQRTSSTHRLSDNEIMNLPIGVPQDIRYALPLIPGVLQDATGQIHVNGSSTSQILDELDGFNITDPASGYFDTRVPVVALRSVTVSGSRYSSQYGKASGGLLALETGMGDDRYHFSGTDVVPSFSTHKGFHLDGWMPRGSVSGPIKKGKAWFLLAPEAEYDLTLVNELPPGADKSSRWRFGDLAKTQINLTPSNILTTDFLVNEFRSNNYGLSQFDPEETTVDLSESIYHVSAIDRFTLHNGVLMEYGVGFSRFRSAELPMGVATYVITPENTSGNYFQRAEGRSERLQIIANLIAPTVRKWGTHEFKSGFDLDSISDVQSFNRHGVEILRQDGTLSRTVSFPGSPSLQQTNFESGIYAADHWSISHRLVLDPGLRLDWDQIVGGARVSPRLAASFTPSEPERTKIVAGVGIYYDQSNLDLYTEPRAGTRIDYFYDQAGTSLIRPPVESVFQIGEQNLGAPWFLNWSVGIEQELPASVFLRTEYLQKQGHDGWTYLNPCAGPNGCFAGRFILESARRDRYKAAVVSVERRFKGAHVIYASYTWSAARSNAVLDFNVVNPYFSPQAGGPLPWDTPNRVVSWGILPLIKQFDLAYTLDWRSGFPFSVVNEDQELVGPPDRLRYPSYFSLNIALEKRVSLFGFRWELRGGFDDITDRQNPYAVDNNIDSPTFLTYGSIGGRSLTGQVRLLGKK
ncbi:MAG: TonB-dependent receptor [Acidobacteriota bacterium]